MADDHICSYYCERLECVLAQRNELRDKYVVPVFSPTCNCTNPPSSMLVLGPHMIGGDKTVAICDTCKMVKEYVRDTVTSVDGSVDVWVQFNSYYDMSTPAVLPKGPSCCCTEPPTPMGLTFYMDSSVGPVQRVDAKCPACGAMVKGLKL